MPKHDDSSEPPPLFPGTSLGSHTPKPALEEPYDQDMRLQMLRAAIQETLVHHGHPLAPRAMNVLADWSDADLRGYVEDELEVADLRAVARSLKAGLDLTFRFPEGEPLTISLE